MDKIIGLGNALVDILVKMSDDSLLDKLNLPKGSMQLIDENKLEEIESEFKNLKTKRSTGGSAGNTISALAKLGAAPGFIGKIGNDENGAYFSKTMRKNGVDVHLIISELQSGVASTLVSSDGERTFGTYLGASSTLCAGDLSKEMFEGYSYLYVEGYLLQDHDLMIRAVQLAKESGLQVCLDMASYNIVEAEREFFDMLITKYVDIVFANESEAFALTGKEPIEALNEISSKCSVAIVKTGNKGSYIKKGTEVINVMADEMKKAVDTTGAGDFYAAGFMYGLTCGYSLEKCAQISTLLAETVIQVLGTELTKKKWDEIKLNIDTICLLYTSPSPRD